MKKNVTRIKNIGGNKKTWFRWGIVTLTLISILMAIAGTALAQDEEERAVQTLTGYFGNRRSSIYTLPNLKQGDKLYIYMQRTSGNLDAYVALADAEMGLSNLFDVIVPQLKREIAAGRDPLVVIKEISDEFFLKWDDDSGAGYDAALEYIVPADGSYQLLAGGTPTKDTFGDFRLLVGVNAPEVLTGKVSPTGDTIAVLNRSASRVNIDIQEVKGILTPERTERTYILRNVDTGDTLYVFVEATSGDLHPVVVLQDFGHKPLRSGNFSGKDTSIAFEYKFDEVSENDRLVISSGTQGEEITTGDFRLLLGLNSPEVLAGKAESVGQPVVHDPIDVKVGIQMDQIAGVDQKAENYDVVANLIFSWQDPTWAFSPDTCDCDTKIFTVSEFVKWATDNDKRYPEFILFNQQGNRWSQSEIVVVRPDGEASYFERFSVTLQAPDFDFRKFPFDSQDFYIRVQLLFSEDVYIYQDLEGASRLGEQLGEEEWVVTDFETIIETVENFGERSQFSYHFNAKRALTFYLIRFFVPLALIILVAWITFFLKNYMRRVEITTGNLLLFIAFNFTISDSLPKLGYLTFLDAILASTFFISVVVVAFNVYLQRLEANGKEELAQRIDKYTLWIYPVAYVVTFGLVYWYFFL